MVQFDCAPAIPLSYVRLNALNSSEIERGRIDGYVEENSQPDGPVKRAGLDNCDQDRADDDLHDWRARVYVIWFCYIFENFFAIDRPLGAIEELILEFKAQDVLDVPGRRLATLYAGAAASEPISLTERQSELEQLKPHYARALVLLDDWTVHAVAGDPDASG